MSKEKQNKIENTIQENVQVEEVVQKTKNRNKPFIIALISIVVFFALIIGFLCVQISAKKASTLVTGYVCSVSSDEILLFKEDGTPIKIETKDITNQNLKYGDRIFFVGTPLKNDDRFYKNIEIETIDRCTNLEWPATKHLSEWYTVEQAIGTRSVVMDGECIVSGNELVTAFEDAIAKQEPYFIRVVNFGDGSFCDIIDVFYDGVSFYVANDISRTDYGSETNKVNYIQYKYCEQYDFNGVVLTYLTNTKDMAQYAVDNNLFDLYLQDNIEVDPLDMFWLYYDMTEYFDNKKQEENKNENNNTLDFENEEFPIPKISIEYQNYYTKVEYEENVGNTEDNSEDIKVNEVTNTYLGQETCDIPPRNIHIKNKDGEYNLTGKDTLSLDLSSVVVNTEKSDTITMNISKDYPFNEGTLKVFSYKDIDNKDATPLQEMEITENSTTINLLEKGTYIYEITLKGDEYECKYVFFLNRAS